MAFSFVIVLFATNSMLMAVYAIASVAFTVLSVVAIMALKGWQLSVCMCTGDIIPANSCNIATDPWSIAKFNELQIQLTLPLI